MLRVLLLVASHATYVHHLRDGVGDLAMPEKCGKNLIAFSSRVTLRSLNHVADLKNAYAT